MESPSVSAMEVPDVSHGSSSSASRPALGFPLGTALLLVTVFSLSGFFSCCYHWEKVQSLRRRLRQNTTEHVSRDFPPNDDPFSDSVPSSPPKPKISPQRRENRVESLPVIMPGYKLPTFMAWPCPCEALPPPLPSPPVRLNLVVKVSSSSFSSNSGMVTGLVNKDTITQRETV